MPFRLGYWTEERRQRAATAARARHGTPEGHASVYSVHVPLRHVVPVRYWAGRIATKHSYGAARSFAKWCSRNDWEVTARLTDLMNEARAVHLNKQTIRELEYWSIRR